MAGILLVWIFRKIGCEAGDGYYWLRIEPSDCNNGFIKAGNF
jgi:hypothetical protein